MKLDTRSDQEISDQVHALIAYVKDNKFVCTMPKQWNKLWQILLDQKQRGIGWEPALPLFWPHGTKLMAIRRLQAFRNTSSGIVTKMFWIKQMHIYGG